MPLGWIRRVQNDGAAEFKLSSTYPRHPSPLARRGHHLLHSESRSLNASNPLPAVVQRTPDAARVAETAASLRARANVAAHELKKLEATYSETLEQLKAHGGDLLHGGVLLR